MSIDETAHSPAASVAVIGGGSIGVAMAVVFVRGGLETRVHEPDGSRRRCVRTNVDERLRQLAKGGLLAEDADIVINRLTVVDDLGEATAGAAYIQECAPERLELKHRLFAELDRLTTPGAILASSSSALPISSVTADLPGRARTLIAHPGNPPFLISVIEIVPAPYTDQATIRNTEKLLRSVGLEPVTLSREIDGFVFNRLQGAVLREAYCLVRDGVASTEDIDRIVRDGLGLRWSVTGPFETVDLNTQGGIESHAEKMGPAYQRMGSERGQHDPWTKDLVTKITAQRRALLPLEDWSKRVAWRDRKLTTLVRHRRMEDDP